MSEFSGDNRYVGDYLTEEVLSRHPAEVRDFIIRVSILDRFSAALCDDVLELSRSATILRDLERANLFLVPLDDEGRWYRFHPLFAAVARAELEVSHPDDVRRMHHRAARWFSQNGNIDESIKHSIAAGDQPAAARLVQQHWLQYVDAGRIATVQYWLHAIGSPEDPPDPATTVTAAWLAAMTGDAGRRWANVSPP
ncbi:hypothetical protein [Aeromicrobium sp. UC242_57]|uniref:hypothetical protein n=1 Tax=Aeromicrobium sp. UC242_57 TaxID=3374624 RepID=UPI00379D7056